VLFRNIQMFVGADGERRQMSERLRHADEKLSLMTARDRERAITLRYSFHE
jgi:hypothetical protein